MTLARRIRRAITGFVDRATGRPVARTMEAAAGGRRWAGFVETRSNVAAQLAGRAIIAARSRSLYNNTALYRSGVDAWTSGLVGSGIRTSPQHPDPAVREALAAGFEAWTDEADADGRTDWYAFQALVVTQVVRDGESFVTFETTPSGHLRVRVHDCEMVDGNLTRDLGGGRFIVQGLEFDASGQVTAYHFKKANPGLPFVSDLSTVPVPAAQVLHVFRRDTAGQVRGVSWGAPIMTRLADYDAAADAHLVRQKIAGLLAGFVTNPEGVASPMDGTTVAPGLVDVTMEPGEMKILPPGYDVRFSDPASIGAEAMEFLRITRAEIAAGLGLPTHLFDADLTEANYSSLREGKIEFRRRCEALQHGMLAFQLLRPVWRRWVTLEALSGRLGQNDFTRNPAPWLAATFTPPRSEWVDPAKDVAAEIAAIDAKLMSRRQAVAARGYDIEALDREIAADRAREESLGLAAPIPETTP